MAPGSYSYSSDMSIPVANHYRKQIYAWEGNLNLLIGLVCGMDDIDFSFRLI